MFCHHYSQCWGKLFPEHPAGFQAGYIGDWSASLYLSCTGLKQHLLLSQAQRSLSLSTLPLSSSCKPKTDKIVDSWKCPRPGWSNLVGGGVRWIEVPSHPNSFCVRVLARGPTFWINVGIIPYDPDIWINRSQIKPTPSASPQP